MCKTTACLECGGSMTHVVREAMFCSRACKTRFSNRRAVRGAELYDLFMACRYQRGIAKVLNLWTILCALANSYKRADEKIRPGFKSWMDPNHVIARNPSLVSTVVGKI